MLTAIYVRKSTEQTGIADDQKSVARQIDQARRYAAAKGWHVADDHVYVDDGISGAEFANRPGFLRLMNALKPRPPFQALVMSEESRLGREAIETAYALKQLVQAGVRVFFYLEDRERTLDSSTDKIMLSLTAFADELEREKARQRTYDAMTRKARSGHVTGGRVFGYDNVDVVTASGQRSHVERTINEAEAAVVRRIFECCAAGDGLTRTTKALNADHVPSPRAQQGRPQAWSASTVRDVLLRPLYRGEIVWNTTRKRDRWGQQRQHARPAAEWMRLPAPQLRIVSDEVWTAAHARLADRQAKYIGGNRPMRDSKYLLSGFAKCAVCGGGFASHLRRHGKQQVQFYGCTAHWKRGPEVCANGLVGRMTAIDAEVLATLQDDVLRPAVVEGAIALALDELSPARHRARQDEIAAALARLDGESLRLADAVAQGGPLDALLERLRRCQAERDALRAQITSGPFAAIIHSAAGLERRLRAKVADWRDLLTRDRESGRAVLRILVAEPFRFTPIVDERRRGYQFTGTLALDRLVAGIVDLPSVGGEPAPVCAVDATASVNSAKAHTGVASPRGSVARVCWPLAVTGYADLRRVA
jgi:DNA invertase Pin-like site-specific DNA recombinase